MSDFHIVTLNVFKRNVVMLSIAFSYSYAESVIFYCLLNVVMPSVVMLNAAFSYSYAESRHAGCRYAECYIFLLSN